MVWTNVPTKAAIAATIANIQRKISSILAFIGLPSVAH
jgi:hypothetical protein